MHVEEIRRCPGCHARASRAAGEAGGFALRSCSACKTLFTAQLPAAEEAEDYDGYYHAGNLDIPDFVHGRLAEIVASFDRYRHLNRWLDVGFGAGALMVAAAARGWAVAGTEVSPRATEAARAQGLEAHLAQVQDLDLPDGSFDVISMVEVLEHVPDPDALLDAASRLLRSGGALYATTPHARGISARLLRTGWSAVSPPEHLQLFSVSGIRAALERAGLTERSVHTHAVNPHELLGALRRVDPAERQATRVETSYRLNEALSSGGVRTFVKRFANGALNAVRAGDGLKLVATAGPQGASEASPRLAPKEDLER